ncbi:hypothetical protein llg_40410 [Luteolibacter sp. LG18]|nr:hypothetical protein llg_40410 [Luteolibacter sp. LG18]
MNPPPPLSAQSRNRGPFVGVIAGALLMCGPVIGLLVCLFSMVRANTTLGRSGIGDPSALALHVSVGLNGLFIGGVAFVLGVIVLSVSVICMIRQRNARNAIRGGAPV